MRGIVAWLFVTCLAWLAGGYFVGLQARPALDGYRAQTSGPVLDVAALLGGRR